MLRQMVMKFAEWVTSYRHVDEDVDHVEDGDNDEVAVNSKKSGDEQVPQRITTSEYGRITSIHDGYGLIDGNIYFDVAVVSGSKLPREGDQVIVTFTTDVYPADDANGKPSIPKDGLVADSVQILTECWDSADDANGGAIIENTSVHVEAIFERPRIGHVKQVESDRFFCNDDICLALKDVTFPSNFKPYVGDWIVLKKFDDESRDGKSVEVSPLRTQSFKGQITSVDNEDIAVVENEFYFYVKDCSGGYLPSVDDIVEGIAAETSARSPAYNWRCISFTPVVTVESQRLQQYARLKVKNLTDLVLNKNGIVVASPLDFGVILVGKRSIISAFMRNEGSVNRTLISCEFADNSSRQFFVTNAKLDKIFDDATKEEPPHQDANGEPNGVLIIPPKGTACVNIRFEAKCIGKTRELLVFEFDGFSIGRQVIAHVKDPKQDLIMQKDNIRERTDDSSPHQDVSNVSLASENCEAFTLPARRIKKKTRSHLPINLEKYPVPMDLYQCVDDRQLLLSRLPCLPQELSMQNYKIKLSSLLHLEEIQQDKNISQFNMNSVSFRKSREFLVLEVPGLAEGRPSVLTGDCIIAIESGGSYDIRFEGCVHDVRGLEIYLMFHEEFHNRFTDVPYDVSFFSNRTPVRRCHQAISLWRRIGKEVLFPDAAKKPLSEKPRLFLPRHIVNKRLNERQLQAVRCIVEGVGRPAPYIIYGPPGTGKTVTLVEAVLQVFLQQCSSRILVCAPSNSAADLVCERLHDSARFTTCDLVRLNAFHRKEESLSEVVRHYSDFSQDYYVVLHYRVIVTTCVTSGMLYALGVPQGHITHLFIDEAGQATEPEALICMCLAAASSSEYEDVRNRQYKKPNLETEEFQVILAGDPKQLGPVIMSRNASTYGLQTSLLERLSKRRLYQRDETYAEGYDPCHVTKLIENYRSHPVLLKLPSKLFYDNELMAKADLLITSALCNWKYLQNSEFPILFHGINGEDLQELDSPSWFNAAEVYHVVCYLQSLYRDMNLKPDDIGIVTPYRKQVDKIRMMIDAVRLEAPKVGSVEEFQGQERMVMIVSTVRSSSSWIHFDDAHNLGFVFNEKRFNVTVTRAKSLLIVVGNPFVLIKDPIWRSFLRYCFSNNAYTGCEVNEIRDMLFGENGD